MTKQSEFIKNARKKCGLTQKQLAQKLNISDKVVSKWEVGASFPDYTLLPELAKILQVEIQEILNGEYFEKTTPPSTTTETTQANNAPKTKMFKNTITKILLFMKLHQNYFFLGFYLINIVLLFTPVIKWAFPAWQFSDNFYKLLLALFHKDKTKYLLGNNLSAMFASAGKNVNVIAWITSIIIWVYVIIIIVFVTKLIIKSIKKEKYHTQSAFIQSITILALSIVTFIVAKIFISQINHKFESIGMDMTAYKKMGLSIKTSVIWSVIWSCVALTFASLFKFLKCLKTADTVQLDTIPPKTEEQIQHRNRIIKMCVIMALIVGVVTGGTFGTLTIIKKNTPSPQNTWNDFISCINNSQYDKTKDCVYYLSEEQEENYDVYTTAYALYSNLSTSSFRQLERQENYSICEVLINGTMIVSGVQTYPTYKYNVYFVKNTAGKWKLLAPVNITSGNNNNYQIDTTNKLIFTNDYSNKTAIFYYGKDFENMTLPDDIVSISGTFFVEHTSISFFDQYTISSSCPTNLKDVVIPYGITTINENAFRMCTSLTSITLPSSLTSIGGGAFGECTSLTSITIPDSLTSLGNYAFGGCTSLTSINIPEGVTNIGDSAFNGCTALTTINIPEGVTDIGYRTFEGCTNLTNITLPSSLTSIDDWAFENCTSLTNITIPDSVTSIGYGAFAGCTSLTSITIPESVTSFDSCDFSGCTNLTSFTSLGSVTSCGDFNFDGCTNLTNVTLPNGVTKIKSRAFRGCTRLTCITIPESVTTIGSGAFEGCTSLTCITIPESVTDIGSGAFDGCTSLSSITILGSVTSCGFDFDRCTNLTSFTFIGNATTCGFSFTDCTNLTSFTFIGSTTSCGVSFNGCTNLTNVTLPNGVTDIGIWAFYGCTSLTSITLPDSVTSIGDSAFESCTSLKSITIPNSVTSIGDDAFENCTSLTSIIIPDSVTDIGRWAFRGCTNLTNITLPDSLTSIGDDAFSSSNVKTIYYKSDKSNWEQIDKNNNGFTNIDIYYYIENAADVPTDGGNYWHHVAGKVTIWHTKNAE